MTSILFSHSRRTASPTCVQALLAPSPWRSSISLRQAGGLAGELGGAASRHLFGPQRMWRQRSRHERLTCCECLRRLSVKLQNNFTFEDINKPRVGWKCGPVAAPGGMSATHTCISFPSISGKYVFSKSVRLIGCCSAPIVCPPKVHITAERPVSGQSGALYSDA